MERNGEEGGRGECGKAMNASFITFVRTTETQNPHTHSQRENVAEPG